MLRNVARMVRREANGTPISDRNHVAYPCVVVDLPVALFNAIAPMYDAGTNSSDASQPNPCDITYLTHVRQLSDSSTNDSTQYAVLVANRSPQLNVKTTAFLVSLENMVPYLPDPDYNPRIDSSQYDTVRLVVLNSWTFTAVDPEGQPRVEAMMVAFNPVF